MPLIISESSFEVYADSPPDIQNDIIRILSNVDTWVNSDNSDSPFSDFVTGTRTVSTIVAESEDLGNYAVITLSSQETGDSLYMGMSTSTTGQHMFVFG